MNAYEPADVLSELQGVLWDEVETGTRGVFADAHCVASDGYITITTNGGQRWRVTVVEVQP